MNRPIFIVYYNLGLGGLQKKIVDIINRLGEERPTTPVFLLLRRKKEDFDIGWQAKNPQVKVYYYNEWMHFKNPLLFPIFIFLKTLRFKPKTILAFSDIPSLSAIWAKILFFWMDLKVVVNERAYTSWYVSHEKGGRLRSILMKIFYPFADKIICLTKATKEDLMSFYGFPSSKIEIIPNWTSMAKEKPLRLKKEFDLIYMGRLTKAKGVAFLLNAFLKIRQFRGDITLCILGDGEERETVLNFIKRKKLENSVTFKGAQYDIRSYLCRSRFLLLTSEKNIEGFPTSVLEAMAMGVPVLTRRFLGLEDVIQDGRTGFIFDAKEDLVRKLLGLLKDPKTCREVSQRAKAQVEGYNSLDNIRHYFKIADI